MLLHQHSVNIERHQQGLPALSSLWFSGVGQLPEQPTKQTPQAVWATRVELAGWSRWSGVQAVSYRPEHSLDDWLDDCVKNDVERVLVEFTIDRRISLEQNLEQLNQTVCILLRQSDRFELAFFTEAGNGLVCQSPPWWTRMLDSQSSRELKALAKLNSINS